MPDFISSRAPRASVSHAARHRRERAHGIDRIEVAKEQDRLAAAGAGKVHLQVVAEILNAMEFGMTADFSKRPARSAPSWSTAGLWSLGDRFLPTDGWFR